MSKSQTEEFHSFHVNNAKAQLLEKGDFVHEIAFARDGREQMMVLIPTGPSRAMQAAAEAIAEADELDVMSVAVWFGPRTSQGLRTTSLVTWADPRIKRNCSSSLRLTGKGTDSLR